jgi:hypothetical protein
MLCPKPYRFTRIRAAHYGGVLKVDGGVGDKNAYDPRSYLKMADGAWLSGWCKQVRIWDLRE